ncbi:MAG: polysaccharide deacetylase family protein [Verrucomicrobiales bacterium]
MNPDHFRPNIPYSPEPRFVWPGGRKCAVMLCFDVDGETTALSEDMALQTRITTMSQCAYGPRVGVPRILGLLGHLSVPATFFIPSWVVEQHPRMTDAVIAAGHEVGAHGHLHEKLASLSPQKRKPCSEKASRFSGGISGSNPTVTGPLV